MPKKKETLLGKIVVKDYNNLLEKVIETKDFDEDVKNLLLSILYKIDVSYKDYKNVKRDVESKQEYIKRFIETIDKKCNTIKIAKPNTKEEEKLGTRTFLVDTQNKSIICYPVERKLLYSISKIDKQNTIIKNKYYLTNKTISDVINIGNNINTVEPLRDFNGWSWLTITKEIENISYNLIYQNLRLLVGEKFLNSWIANTEYVIDYYEEFKNELSEKYGEKLKEKIILVLEKLSVLLEIEINPEHENGLKQLNAENEARLVLFENKEELIEKLTEEKKKIGKKLNKIEKILSDKQLLAKECEKINKKRGIEEKIFSIQILEKQMKAEKQNLLEELEEKNELLNPKKFISEKNKLEERKKILQIAEIKDKHKEKDKMLKEFQELFLKCFCMHINNAETKEEIINLIYELRYYNFLPFDSNGEISQNKVLKNMVSEVEELLLQKAIEYKVIQSVSKNLDENIKLLQFIFRTRIISIEDIYISIKKEKDKYYVEFSENNENSYEEKFEIDTIQKEKLNIRLNKKSKILY